MAFAAVGSLLLFWWNRSRSGWFVGWHHRWSGWSTATVAAGAVASRRATLVAATLDHVVATQLEGLFGLTNHTAIAVTQRTGQSGDDFGAAAAILTNLIANFVGGGTTNSFIGIVQTIDKRCHDFRIADAVISVTELTQRGTSLTSIASRLRNVDELGDIARIRVAASCFANRRAGRRTGCWSTA